jgi:hypothetical protein
VVRLFPVMSQTSLDQSSSGGTGDPVASALFKPDVRISRIRLAQILSSRACTGNQS